MRRILIEASNALTRLDLAEALLEHGVEVTTCRGDVATCPVLAGEPCPLIDEADAVVNALSEGQIEVHLGQRAVHPDHPVLLLTDCWHDEALADPGGGVEVAPGTAGGDDVALRIIALLDDEGPS